MERLTFDGNFCDIAQCRELPCTYGGNCSQKQVWDRLKEYEDSGLSPQACRQAREIEDGLSATDYSISRMVELMNADKDGRVVVLPCKVGDTVYRTWTAPGRAPFIEEARMRNVVMIVSLLRKFGKPVFSTCEEAEKALQEMEGKKDGR